MWERGHRRGPGELETEVLAALWAAAEPLTATQVQTRLGTPLAHTTVQTILVRLHEKGLATREPAGRAHVYRPAQGQAERAAQQMHDLLTGGRDHLAVLQQFLDRLSPDDADALRGLVHPPVSRSAAVGGQRCR